MSYIKTFAVGLLASSISSAFASDLLITEVVEGSSNNKAVEITNISAADVDLSSYNLAFYFNGNSNPSNVISLNGLLAQGQSYVIADHDASADILNVTDLVNNGSFFSGDDAIALRAGSTLIDVVGQIGSDPGSQWGSGETSTKDNTIARNTDITAGDNNGSDIFDPSAEWTGFAQDTFSGLGSFAGGGNSGGNNGGAGGGTSGGSLEGVCLNCPDLQKVADATAFDAGAYYLNVQTEIDANSDRAVIKQVLSETIAANQKELTYSEVWTALTETDEDPNNPDNVILFYSGWSLPKLSNGSGSVASSNPDNWNREHSWPKSHGFSSPSFEAHNDIHHLRPTDISINSSRGNLDFDNSDNALSEAPDNRIDGDSFEPRDAVKGDVARMMFYMDTRYEGVGDATPDLTLVDRLTTTSEDALGELCTLRQWHLADPVDATETERHNTIYEYQGNRNPFVDNPQWVDVLYPESSCSGSGGGTGGSGGSGGSGGGTGGSGGSGGSGGNTGGTASGVSKPFYISGVVDGPLPGGLPKAIEIHIAAETSLAGCGIGAANNGGGSDGEEFSFPAQTFAAGSYVYVATETNKFTEFFGFAPTFTSGSAAGVNGDDAIELFCDQEVIDTFGDINVDGTGEPWEYLDGWAYRQAGSSPTGNFVLADWQFSGKNALDGESDNSTASTPFPIGTHVYTAPEIYFSEYAEGSGNNKAVEIYNPALTPVDLSNYNIQIFFNGKNSAGQTINLSGTLNPFDVAVVVNSNAADATLNQQADITTGQLLFNGDDAVTLRKGNNLVDSIGQIGTDPGSQWGSGEQSTANNTLRRKAGVTVGDVNASDAFDPSIEWDGFAQDTFDDFGTYGNAGGGNGGGNGSGGNGQLGLCADPATLISAIQGAQSGSPLVGESHVIEAIVSASFEGLDGFFAQQAAQDYDADPNTSEGIFVSYQGLGALPAAGDVVRVIGTVEESFDKTRLVATESYLACGQDQVVATSISLPLPQGLDLESLEGMLVTSNQLVTLSDVDNYARFGEVVLSSKRLYTPTHVEQPGSAAAVALAEENARNRLILDDDRDGGVTQYPFGTFSPEQPLRVGTQLNGFEGVLDYAFNRYRVRPTTAPNVAVENARTSAPVIAGGNLKVASFNVLNLFNGDGQQNGFPTSRGASNLSEYERQLAKIVGAIVAIDADVVGLMEIENDGFGALSAIAQLTDALNTQAGAGTYDFIVPSVSVGTDEIMVAILYKPANVIPVGSAQVLSSANSASDDQGPLFNSNRNRPSVAQKFSLTDNGAEVVVNVNHFKSKGSGCGAGDDDEQFGQGRCNGTRTRAAEGLAIWLGQTYPELPVIILGDLNAYAMEAPITALQQAGYTDLARLVDGVQAYSYEFNGEYGSLDYALANQLGLDALVDVEEWHINADEPGAFDYNDQFPFSSANKPGSFINELPYRASDHDPVVATFRFDGQPQEVRGDWDGDGDVDLMDYYGLLRAIMMRQPVDLKFDLDNDGRITTLDARVLLTLCTRPNCAV